MGSFSSKTTTSNNTEERQTAFQQFTNSIRRSLRVKRQHAGVVDGTHQQNQASSMSPQKTPSRVRPGLPEGFQQESTGSVTTTTPSKETPQSSTKVAAAKTPEVPKPTPRVVEPPQNTAPTSGVTEAAKEKEATDVDGAMNLLKEAIASKGIQEDKKDAKKDESRKEENIHHIENILSQLAPADDSKDLTPETEKAPKPAVSLLAALEKRKAKEEQESKEGNAKTETTSSTGVTHVLETIAVESSAIKSKEAANLMASLSFPPSPKAEEKQDEKKKEEEHEDQA